MVTDLFKKDRNSSNNSLVSLTQNGIKWLAYLRVTGPHKHEGYGHMLDLLNNISDSCSLMHVLRNKAEDESQGFEQRVLVEDFYGKRHGHDRFACQDIRSNLFGQKFDNSFLNG